MGTVLGTVKETQKYMMEEADEDVTGVTEHRDSKATENTEQPGQGQSNRTEEPGLATDHPKVIGGL